MRKRIKSYLAYMDELVGKLRDSGTYTEAGLEDIKREHLVQIQFFQHERLIHLIVTALFAIVEFISVFMLLVQPGLGTFALVVAVLVLLIPYIAHYYLLENGTQHMYEQYDELCRMQEKARK